MDKANFNKIYPKRSLPFNIKDYPITVRELWQQKCKNVDEVVASLPKKLRCLIGFLGGQPRQLLRSIGKRKDFEAIECFAAFLLEPYEFLTWPATTIKSCFFFTVERLLNNSMKKTVQFLPKQLTQIPAGLTFYHPEYVFTSASVPNEDGYINLGLSSVTDEQYLRECLADPTRKVILEINCHVPWVNGDPALGNHCIHLSQVAMVYEHHEPQFELPPIQATDREQQIAEHALKYIQNGSTLQFGIGGIPNYIASRIGQHRDLGIHTEMFSDGIVDLHEAGAVSNRCKGHRDGVSVCTFVIGSNRLYDWVDRNPQVCILPINEVNNPYLVAKCNNFISINAGIMVDLYGQICSDTFNFKTYSGFGGQLEFVQGSQLAPNGHSLICIKSVATINDNPISNVVSCLPPGAMVTVPRCFTDVVITEYGIAELRAKSNLERAHALVNIADPKFREALAADAKKHGIWDESCGFEKTSQKLFYQSANLLVGLKRKLSLKYWANKLGGKN